MPDQLAAPWPDNPVVYEVYPRSFQDSDGDGIGDLSGVLQKLDYIADLGADALWLCPFTQSPWVDGGYDPSSYTDIHPALGSLDVFKDLVDAAHARSLRIVVDLVLNHTSDQHPWFDKSAERDAGYEDYYVWQDAKPTGALPNNWLTRFGPPAWTWHHKRKQYYFHNYLPQQPALNLRCQQVQDELKKVINTWTSRGVDGFRLDAVTSYLFDTEFRDNPPAQSSVSKQMDGDDFLPYNRQDHRYDLLPGDGTDFAKNLRQWAGDDIWLLGEVGTGNQSIKISDQLTQPGRLNAAYPVDIPQFGFNAETLSNMLSASKRPTKLGWWTQSHDRSRVGMGPDDLENLFQLFFLCFFPGTVLLYQGQELGLPQPQLEHADITDPYDQKYWPDGPGREGARVPMPWDNTQKNFGFSDGDPWLPMRWPKSCAANQQRSAGPLRKVRQWLKQRKQLSLHAASIGSWSREGDLVTMMLQAVEPLSLFLNFAQAESATLRGECITASADIQPVNQLPPRSGAVCKVA